MRSWFQRLKPKCDELRSNVAFKFDFRRYGKSLGTKDPSTLSTLSNLADVYADQGRAAVQVEPRCEPGVETETGLAQSTRARFPRMKSKRDGRSGTPGSFSKRCIQYADFGLSPGGNAHTELLTERQRSARESGRQVECPCRVADKASALSAGSDIPKSACCNLRPSITVDTTKPRNSTITVGWCRLTVLNPELKVCPVPALETKMWYAAFKRCFHFQLAPLQHVQHNWVSREVGRRTLTGLQPVLKAPMVSGLETEVT